VTFAYLGSRFQLQSNSASLVRSCRARGSTRGSGDGDCRADGGCFDGPGKVTSEQGRRNGIEGYLMGDLAGEGMENDVDGSGRGRR
jgi:hypothetical protein